MTKFKIIVIFTIFLSFLGYFILKSRGVDLYSILTPKVKNKTSFEKEDNNYLMITEEELNSPLKPYTKCLKISM